MARETKAQRLEREAEERRLAEVQERESYPARLMAVLERAMKVNFEMTVRDAAFVVRDPDDRYAEEYFLYPEYSVNHYYKVVDLEFAVVEKEDAEREAQRRLEVRRSAIAKLTDEERELLNLK